MTLISALIVAFNPNNDLRDCLDSLMTTAVNTDFEIIVVDNASSNGYIETIKTDYSMVQFVRSDENLGFGGGNNLAFEHSTGEYVICVNPDLLLTQDALDTMLTHIKLDDTIGLVAPRTITPDNQLVYTARGEYTIGRIALIYWGLVNLIPSLAHGQYTELMQSSKAPFDVEWVQGSCMLMRRETFAQVNGFDAEFFLYYEDTDLCNRIRQLGLKIVYLPTATVIHGEGTTTRRFPTYRVKSYHFSPIYYFRKQNQHSSVFALKLIFTVELIMKILIRSIQELLNPVEARQKHRQAELQVLQDLWSY